MAIAKRGQWVTLAPLPIKVRDKIKEGFEILTTSELYKWLLSLTLSRKKKIVRAITHAKEIADAGEVSYQSQTHIHFVRLWVYTEKHEQYRLDLGHRSHFIGPYTKFPEFEERGRIKFTFRRTRLPYSDPKKTSSYLEIEYVR